jgi:hypothetical protein
MTAIRPNMNFDNEHKEHVPYQNKASASMQDLYNKLMKAPVSERHRSRAVIDPSAYERWFKSDK